MIPWNLSCEAQGKTREFILKNLDDSNVKQNPSIKYMLVDLVGIIILSIAGTIALIKAGVNQGGYTRNPVVFVITLLLLLLAVLTNRFAESALV